MENRELERFLPIAKMIGRTFGKHCEVVLHDLAHPKHSVVYVANNQVTGREVGQSFDHLIREVLLSPDLHEDQRCNYVFTAENGAVIKSSTVLIRDHCGKAIGALCVNIDVTAIETAADTLLSFVHTEPESTGDAAAEDELSSVGDVLDELISRIVAGSDGPAVTRRQRLELISFMDSKGVFLVKGAVEKVADKMGVSAVTVYSYLDETRKRRVQQGDGRDVE